MRSSEYIIANEALPLHSAERDARRTRQPGEQDDRTTGRQTMLQTGSAGSWAAMRPVTAQPVKR